MLWSPTFDVDSAELLSLMQNRMLIDRLIRKKMSYLSRSLPVFDNLNGLSVLFRLAFESIVEIYISNRNKY